MTLRLDPVPPLVVNSGLCGPCSRAGLSIAGHCGWCPCCGGNRTGNIGGGRSPVASNQRTGCFIVVAPAVAAIVALLLAVVCGG